MINLIPPEGHSAIKKEYLFRVGTTLAFLFGGVFLLLAVLFVPTYVLTNAQINEFVLGEKQENGKEDPLQNVEHEVILTKEILTQMKSIPSGLSASDIIEEIQRVAPPNVEFKTFSIESQNGVPRKVYVQGSAPTREALAQLKSTIEASDMFLTAELPIADLARGVDLLFAITITLAPTS